jgi:hypothetical protein
MRNHGPIGGGQGVAKTPRQYPSASNHSAIPPMAGQQEA